MALVAIGVALPSADSPINVIGVLIAAFWAAFRAEPRDRPLVRSGRARRRERARLVRRLLGVWWGGAIFCVLIAGFAEVMSPLPVDAWSAVYLVLLAAVVVPGGVAFCAAGNILGRFRV